MKTSMQLFIEVLLVCVITALAAPAYAGDFYVITDTFTSQAKAQEKAALNGGWALDTDLYDNLKPGLFVVVRGPYKNQNDANKELASLKQTGGLRDTYVKDAGQSKLPGNIGETMLNFAVLTAILGEIEIDVSDHRGGDNPCEPQEAYQAVHLSYVGLDRQSAGKFSPKREEIKLGGFWIIKRTGEIDRMRVCAE